MNKYTKILLLLGIGLFAANCSTLPEPDLHKNRVNKIKESHDFIVVSSEKEITETFIFYPGGLVVPNSYLKWQDKLVQKRPQMRIVTVKMPSNLAVLNSNKGKRLFAAFSDTEKWYIGGHSLGGAMLGNLVANNPETFSAIFYLAAYPANDKLKEFEGSILSIWGSEDGLVSDEDIEERKDLLPTPYEMKSFTDFPDEVRNKTMYYKMLGANHAQFGHYGEQDGDNTARLTTDEQQEAMRTLMIQLLDRL